MEKIFWNPSIPPAHSPCRYGSPYGLRGYKTKTPQLYMLRTDYVVQPRALRHLDVLVNGQQGTIPYDGLNETVFIVLGKYWVNVPACIPLALLPKKEIHTSETRRVDFALAEYLIPDDTLPTGDVVLSVAINGEGNVDLQLLLYGGATKTFEVPLGLPIALMTPDEWEDFVR